MILNFLKKVPAGMMVIPLLLGSLIVTIFPNAFEIGGLTAAVFSSAGTNTLLGAQLFCMGTALSVKDMPKVLKRGGVLLLAKFAIGAGIGILVGKVFGAAGFLGLTPLAIICAVTNSNGSVYLTLMGEYGDEADCGCFPLLALNDGPFFTLVALGASGLANIPFQSLIAAIIPIALGMLLGNLDKGLRNLFAPMGSAIIPLIGFALGTGINLTNVIKGGFPGILLGLITVFVGGGFILLCDKFITRRPGYAAWAVATTAGNAVAVPAAVALIDTAWEPYVATVTVQVAASVVVSCILAPIITSWWAKKHGCPKMPLEGQEL
ncbi:2-keto-3-deoxygluconate permease [Coprococcus comes]|uniref:2-keto-3-deoxygluconate permease n=1 Tax=Coprococcus comes TaxID=410072 RepID=A0A3E4GU65_9FIRM|nr:2-keto-3-deoxygluconate permease [Coprococcus comes]NSF19026.1 2-keto-3-deoxygluconate permease [Coprococcus comes]RGJ26340.1 2-keto-3-deoxygluconate permease [Coprococcus comes]RGU47557.1 2-keto-3-deoxygluconate permease [Coprococcus comes]